MLDIFKVHIAPTFAHLKGPSPTRFSPLEPWEIDSDSLVSPNPPPPATMHLVAIGPAIGFIGRFINKICEIKGTAKQDVQDEPVSRDLSGSKFS